MTSNTNKSQVFKLQLYNSFFSPYLGGFPGPSVYMKSLMLRSSRAFLGGGGFLGLWAAPGDICRHNLALELLSAGAAVICTYEIASVIHFRVSVLPALQGSLRWKGSLASPSASWELLVPRPDAETDGRRKRR